MLLCKEGVIILCNCKIYVTHSMRDLSKEPPRYDVIGADGGAFWGCNGILQKEVPDRVANVARHDETTTNHAEVLTKDHGVLRCLMVLGITSSLMYFMKYNCHNNSNHGM